MKFYSKKAAIKNSIAKLLYNIGIRNLNLYFWKIKAFPMELQRVVVSPHAFGSGAEKLERFNSKDIFELSIRKTRHLWKLEDRYQELREKRKKLTCFRNKHQGQIQTISHFFGTAGVVIDYCPTCKEVLNRVQTLHTNYNFLPITKQDITYFNEFGVLSRKVKPTHLDV